MGYFGPRFIEPALEVTSELLNESIAVDGLLATQPQRAIEPAQQRLPGGVHFVIYLHNGAGNLARTAKVREPGLQTGSLPRRSFKEPGFGKLAREPFP